MVEARYLLATLRLLRLKRWLLTTEGKRFLGLLVVAVIVRVGLSYFLRVSPDLQAYETWGELLLSHFLHPYSVGIQNPNIWMFPTYPPLTMYLYALIDLLYFGSAHMFGLHVSSCVCSNVFRPVLLIPGFLSDLAQVSIIYALARTKFSAQLALLVSASYAFSLAVLIDGVGWGQTDNLALLITTSALLLALRRNGVWAGVLLGLAIALKPQPWVFIPLALIYLYRWGGWQQAVKALASMVGTALALWGPYLLPPRPEIISWQRAVDINVKASGLYATRNAYNLWWLLGAQHQNVNAPFLGFLSPQLLGAALFAGVIVLAVAGIWRDGSPGRLWASAALLSIGFFDVATLQYERYIYPAVGLFLLAALYERRYWLLYAAASVSAFMCLGATVFFAGYGLAAQVRGVHRIGAFLSSNPVTLCLAVANIGILLVATWVFVTPLTSRGELEGRAGPSSQTSANTQPQFAS